VSPVRAFVPPPFLSAPLPNPPYLLLLQQNKVARDSFHRVIGDTIKNKKVTLDLRLQQQNVKPIERVLSSFSTWALGARDCLALSFKTYFNLYLEHGTRTLRFASQSAAWMGRDVLELSTLV